MQISLHGRTYNISNNTQRPHVHGTGVMVFDRAGKPLGRMNPVTVMAQGIHDKFVQAFPLDPQNSSADRFLSVPKMGWTQRRLQHAVDSQGKSTHQMAFILRQIERILRINNGDRIQVSPGLEISISSTAGVTIYTENEQFCLWYEGNTYWDPLGPNKDKTWHIKIRQSIPSSSAHTTCLQVRPNRSIPLDTGMFEVKLFAGVLEGFNISNAPGQNLGEADIALIQKMFDLLSQGPIQDKLKKTQMRQRKKMGQ